MEALTGEHNLADCALLLFVVVYTTNRSAESAENWSTCGNWHHLQKQVAVRVKEN